MGPFEQQVERQMAEGKGADLRIDHKAVLVLPARYARGKVSVQTKDSKGGFKGDASYLAGALKMKYSNREGAYITSPAKAKKLVALLDAGWDGNLWGDKFIPPQSDEIRAARRAGDLNLAGKLNQEMLSQAQKLGIKVSQIQLP